MNNEVATVAVVEGTGAKEDMAAATGERVAEDLEGPDHSDQPQ